jgi:hypothetical protein
LNSSAKKLERISAYYHNQFLTPPDSATEIVKAGKGYLAVHGIDSREVVDKYRLGIVAEPLPGDERFAGMLCIPYLSHRGGVKAIKYRRLAGDGPKVAQYQSQQARLYNTRAWFECDDAIGLCEGEPDAMCASQHLTYKRRGRSYALPAMGIPGAEMWAAHEPVWAICFKDVRTVFMFCHGDSAGRELGRQVAESLRWRVTVVDMPDGEDVSSLVASGKSDWFTDKLTVEEDDDD